MAANVRRNQLATTKRPSYVLGVLVAAASVRLGVETMTLIARSVSLFLTLTCFASSLPQVLGEKEREILRVKANAAILTPDGNTLIASGGDKTWLVDIASMKITPVSKRSGRVALSADGKTLATDDGRDVVIHDLASTKPKGSFLIRENGALAYALSPDGTSYAHGTLKNLVLVNAADGKVKQTFKDIGAQPWALAFSPDGKLLACGLDGKGLVLVLDAATLKVVRELKGLPNRDFSTVQSVAFTPDSKCLAASCADSIKIWSLADGREVGSFTGNKDSYLHKVVFAKAGKILVSASSDGLVAIWDVEAGKLIDALKFDKSVFEVSMSADAKVLAARTAGEVKVFDISDLGRK